MSRWKLVFSLLVVGLVAASGTSWASDVSEFDLVQIRTLEPSLEIVAVSPRIINHGDVDTTVIREATSGLHVVGVGEQVFLTANPGISTSMEPVLDVTATVWSLVGPTGSTATLTEAPEIDGREIQLLEPDMVGDYEVSVTMTHADGDTSFTRTITAAKYLGAASCATCHSTQHAAWVETGHADMLERGLKGLRSHRPACYGCHTVGMNTSALAFDGTGARVASGDNDGFGDVADGLSWEQPADLTAGVWALAGDGEDVDAEVGQYDLNVSGTAWDALPTELKALAGIQCESCHGPGGSHNGNKAKIGKSLANGVCARCHDDGHYHNRPEEYLSSGHGLVWARGPSYAGGSCNACHLGSGYVELVAKGNDSIDADELESGPTQTCAVCHDPHGVTGNKAQIRVAGEVSIDVLVPGTMDEVHDVTGEFGTAAQCAQCHNMRPGRNVVDASLHHSHQTEMVMGVGAYESPGFEYASGSHKHIENVCAACHMAKAPEGGELVTGGHSWNMHTTTAAGVDIYNTTGCASCHGPIQDFNVNGAQDEIHELLTLVTGPLPKSSSGELYTHDNGGHGSAPEGSMSPGELKAAWNAAMVEFDGSGGVHNAVYAKAILTSALAELGGEEPSASAGDFDNDGKVGFSDVFMFVDQFGKTSADAGFEAKYDLNGNGVVGFSDWLMLLDLFGASTAMAKTLPVVENGLNTGALLSIVGSNHPSIDSDHIAVTLRADNLTEMRGYGAVLTYDTEVLEFVRAIRVSDGLIQTAEGGTTLAAIAREPGTITLSDAINGDKAVNGSGNLVDLVFRRVGIVTASSVEIDFAQLSDLSYGVNLPTGAEVQQAGPVYSNSLTQNFPNPFNPATTIRYSLAQPGDVKVVVYNTLGQEVRTLVNHYRLAGEYSVKWDGRDSGGREVASGTYMYQMTAGDFTNSARMVLLK
jgi:predicted CXXCH cytochrome family protein